LGSLDLAGRYILVVEDEPLVCLDLTERLQRAGAVVFAASHLNNALSLADHPDLSAGVLDFDLGKADSTAVCWKLVDRRIPFIFHTGRVYSAFRQWPSAPVILKPSTHGLISAVAALFH
jgi:DNA-binding response OmpR family regulator